MIRIGTSGWSYPHWQDGVFYPKNLKKGQELEFYAQKFDSVEVNFSFYHLPKESTFQGWYNRTPKDFLFSVKGSRYISHVLKLKDCAEPLQLLLERASHLKEKLGPILFQLPPSLKINLDRLESFIKLLPSDQRFTFEFRHPSWFCESVYQLLSTFNVVLTIADTPEYPISFEVTADFVYARFHGHEKLYASQYSRSDLAEWAKRIKKWTKESRDVYIYFDNDAEGYAPQNACELKELLLK